MNTKKILLIITVLILGNYAYGQNCSVNAGVTQTVCANGSLTLTGNYSGLFPSLGRITAWSQISGPQTTITSPASLVTSVTGLMAGTCVYRLSSTCEDGSLIYNDVTVNITAAPTANAGADFSSLCVGTYSFAAPALNSGETGTWSWVSGPTVSISNVNSPTSSFTTSNGSVGTCVYRWTLTKNGCSSSDDVNIPLLGAAKTITASSTTATACYNTTTNVTLTGSYANGTNGTWTLVSGPNTPSISNVNNYKPSVTNLIQGVYIFRWTVVNESCATGSADVVVNVPAPVGAVTAATSSYNGQSTVYFCDSYPTEATLVGKIPLTSETILWSSTSSPSGGTATFSSTTTPTTKITNLQSGYDYTFNYRISGQGSCVSNATAIKFYGQSTLSLTSSNPTVLGCGVTTDTIKFATTSGGTMQYSILSGPVTVTYPTIPKAYANTTSSSTVVLTGLTVPGIYLVRLKKTPPTGSNCAILYADINVIVSQSPSLSNAGSSQVLACNIHDTELVGNSPTVGNGKWSEVSGPNTVTITNPALARCPVSGLVSGNYVFRWLISGGSGCGTNQSDVNVRVASATPTVANAGRDTTICNGTPLYLYANTPQLNETGTWSVSPSSGVTFSNVNSPTAVVTGLAASSTYTFTWRIVNSCGTSTDNVVVTTSAIVGPIASLAGSDQCLSSGTTSITLAGNNPSPGTGLWTKISGGSATITNSSLYNTTVTGMTNGTYLFEWAINRNVCTTTRDTVMITISGAATTANAGADQLVCGATTTLAGNTVTTGTGTWTQITGNGGVAISNIHSPTPTLTNLTEGIYTFRWTISNGACASNSDDVMLNVFASPSAATVNTDVFNVCSGSTGTATMSAVAPAFGTGYWTVISGNGAANITTTNSTTTTVTGMNYGTYILGWNVSNGLCVNTKQVTINVSPDVNAGATQNLCGQYSTTLSGNAYSNGIWLWVSGPNTVNPVAIPSSSTASVSGLIAGTYVFKYEVPAIGSCPIKSANVTINVYDSPNANAGVDKDLCDVTSWAMTATAAGTGETGTWSPVGTSTAIISDVNNPSAVITNATAGSYTFKWTVTNNISGGNCISEDLVNIRISVPVVAAAAGPDQTICGSTATMDANAITGGMGTWSLVSGTGGTVTNINNPATTITALPAGDCTYRWTATNGACNSTYDDVILHVSANPTIPNAGTDQNIAYNVTTVTLAGNNITSFTTRLWSQVSGPTCTITTPSSRTSTVTSMNSPGVYVLRWTATLGTCSLSDDVVITKYAEPTVANAGVDTTACLYTPISLTGSVPLVGTGTWTQVLGTTLTISNPSNYKTSILGAVAGTYTFRWTIVNGIAGNSHSDDVILTVAAIPTMANAGIDKTIKGRTATMTGNTISVGTGTWSRVSTPTKAAINEGVITNPNSPTTTITNLKTAGAFVYRWTSTNNGSCASYDEVTINKKSYIVSNKKTATPKL